MLGDAWCVSSGVYAHYTPLMLARMLFLVSVGGGVGVEAPAQQPGCSEAMVS